MIVVVEITPAATWLDIGDKSSVIVSVFSSLVSSFVSMVKLWDVDPLTVNNTA